MAAPVVQNITLYRGQAVNLVFTISGTANCSGWEVSFIVRPKVRCGNEAVITRSVGAGVTVDDPSAAKITVALTATDTDFEPRSYDFTLARTDSGLETPLTVGTLLMKPNTVLGTQTCAQ